MKKITTCLILIFTLVALSSCLGLGPGTSNYTFNVQKGEPRSINLGYYGLENDFIIIVPAEHADSTKTYIPDGDSSVHYYYAPDTSYTGEDFIKLAQVVYRIQNPSKYKIEEYYEFVITVVE